MITAKFSYLEYSKLSYLVENDLPYHKFHGNILENENELYEKFKYWISIEISQQDFKVLTEKSKWYSTLVMLELNHIYKLWYKEEPSLPDNDLMEYLRKNEIKYYNRIKSFHFKTTVQK